MAKDNDPIVEELIRLLVPTSKREMDDLIKTCEALEKRFPNDRDFIEPQLWPLRIKQIWDDPRTLSTMADVVGFCGLKLLWRIFLQPHLTAEQHEEKYREDAYPMLREQLRTIFAEPQRHYVDTVSKNFVSSFDAAYTMEMINLVNSCRQAIKSVDGMIETMLTRLKMFESSGFGQTNPRDTIVLRAMIAAAESLGSRIIIVHPSLIASLHDLSAEYIRWLRDHPNALDVMAYDAFEKLIAEIFAAHGFQVDITARLRNRHADIIAVRSGGSGVETKYLIECKRYNPTRPVGMGIVQQVLGALQLVKADYAFLVTTSSFTRDVERIQAELTDMHLHLRDGARVREWLQGYKCKTDSGLWLREHWNET